ncbi:MAG: AMP-binding protein [Christensenellales bacterium]|jgi:acetyl-CoA synthetase
MAEYTKYLTKTSFDSYEDYAENFKIVVPENFNFAFDVLDAIAEDTPNKLALMWAHEDGRERRMTFGEIADLSKRAANVLTAHGIERGDAVMLVLKRHYTFWVAIMALHRIGAVAVPATHLLTQKDIVYRCERANIKLILASSEGGFTSQVDRAMPECPTLQTVMAVDGAPEGWVDFEACVAEASADFPRPKQPFARDENMLMYFTSGTSGMPKMVAHGYDYPLGHIQSAVYWQQCAEDGLHLTVSETGWAKSVWGKLYGQWLAGCAVMAYDFDKFKPAELLRVIEKYKVTSLCAPPTIYRFMMLEDLSVFDLSNLRHCTTAGEPLNPEVFNKWKEITGHEMREIFGQTELCVTVGTFPWMAVKPGSMGKPSPMFDVELVDESGAPCQAGEVGEIVVYTRGERPVGMFLGYYRDDARTESVWSGDVYHTLDLAWRDEWGYYWYVGRADDLIKSSGYRIGPFEVESALMEHPAVVESAITGVPDAVRGQIIKATIVLAKGYAPSDALVKELQEHVKRTTAPYKYPRIIEFVDALPKTISNKIRRVELRERDAQNQ